MLNERENMKKYTKPSAEIVALESMDIITASSGVVDNGQKTYEDEKGNVYSGSEGTFFSWFESIW